MHQAGMGTIILILADGACTADLVASTRLEKERKTAMATINTNDLMDMVKDCLEKAGCTDVKVSKTFYIIKNHSVAKQNNKSFAGEEAFYYSGKGGKLLKATGSHIDNDKFYSWPREYTRYALEEYGYKRYCDACRVAKAQQKWAKEHNDRDDYYWHETITIVAETIMC